MKNKSALLIAAMLAASVSCVPIVGAYDVKSLPNTATISPYLLSIKYNSPELSISQANATITIRYGLSTNCIAKVSTALQKSSTGNSWSKVQGWYDTDSGSGTHTNTHNASISKGYYYRVSCTVSTYDSSGKLIETNTAYSNSIYCPST